MIHISLEVNMKLVNKHFQKNQIRTEIKAHHYIINFDPRDHYDNGFTPEHAQTLGMEFARRYFPGHFSLKKISSYE